MQFLNNDMDELFRNAADHYPLKTDGSDWNAVMAKLQAADAPASAGVQKPGGKYYRLLWLLLLTPLAFIAHLPHTGKQQSVIAIATIQEDTLLQQKQQNTAAAVPEKKSEAGATVLQPLPYSTNKALWQPHGTGVIEQTGNILERLSTQKKEMGDAGVPGATSFWLKSDKAVDTIAGAETVSDKTVIADVAAADTGKVAVAGMDTLPGRGADSGIAAAPVIKKPVKERSQVKGLYLGVVVSPDISSVKGQRVAHAGYSAGVLVGYRVSNRLAVETGLLWDKKYYYSEGEYFDTKKLPYQPPWDIKNVNGWCRMFELPLNVRYFFAGGKKNNWYANVGVSSYIMNKESYDYSYDWNNVTRTMNRSYDNATRNWFNIMHLGVGLERSAGVLGTLRVEPYIKAAIGGVGIGSLPLTSFGINVGITRTIRF